MYVYLNYSIQVYIAINVNCHTRAAIIFHVVSDLTQDYWQLD